MADQNSDRGTSGWTKGFVAFAGIMMVITGVFQAIDGFVGILRDDFYVPTENYLLEFDTTTWGWINLLIGILVILAGTAVLSGQTWGRVVAICLASLSMVANFAFLPYYPLWALIVIAIDVLVICALVVYRPEYDF